MKMSLRKRMLRGGFVISSGQLIQVGISTIRNIIVARLIATEADFGIASTIILVVAMYETLSYLGIQTLILQDKEGDDLEFLSVMHFVSFIRGFIGTIILLCLAYPFAIGFGIPQAVWAFAMVGTLPLLRGLIHLDMYRMQRQHSFIPVVLQDVGTQMISLGACFPLLLYYRDYSSVVYLLVLQTVAMVGLSHCVAKLPYRWSRDRRKAQRIFSFGVPLLLSGILTFLILQGERFVLGSSSHLFSGLHYSLVDMAAFSAACMISLLAPMLISRVLVGLFLPLLSHSDECHYLQRSVICVQVSALAGATVTMPMILFGDSMVGLIFSHRYSAAGPVVACVAAAQALRTLRVGAIVALEARGYTWETLKNNLWRTTAFPGCIFFAVAGFPMIFIAVPAIIGELIAIVKLSWQLKERCAIPISDVMSPCLFLVVGLSIAGVMRFYFGGYLSVSVSSLFGLGLWICFVLGWIATFSPTARLLRGLFFRSLGKSVATEPLQSTRG